MGGGGRSPPLNHYYNKASQRLIRSESAAADHLRVLRAAPATSLTQKKNRESLNRKEKDCWLATLTYSYNLQLSYVMLCYVIFCFVIQNYFPIIFTSTTIIFIIITSTFINISYQNEIISKLKFYCLQLITLYRTAPLHYDYNSIQ